MRSKSADPDAVAEIPQSQVARGRVRSLAANALLSLVSMLVALVVAEAILRIQEPFLHLTSRYFNLPLFFANHPIWDHWRTPGIRVTFPGPDPERYPRPAEFISNGQGLRDAREVGQPKPDGVRRIFVLGDSFTEGMYAEDTMAPRLEKTLNASSPSLRYEVFNEGCLSYSPLLHYLRLKYQLLDLQPDAVVVNLDLTDVYDDSHRYGPKCVWGIDGEPERIQQPLGRRIKSFLKCDLYVGRVLDSIKMRAFPQRDPPSEAFEQLKDAFSYFSKLPVDSPRWREDVSFFLGNITRIISLCRKRGVEVVITMIPHHEQITPDAEGHLWHREVEQRVEALCLQHGVAFYSPYEGISRAVRAGEPVYWPHDFHFTPEGQRIWSDLVSQFLVTRWIRSDVSR